MQLSTEKIIFPEKLKANIAILDSIFTVNAGKEYSETWGNFFHSPKCVKNREHLQVFTPGRLNGKTRNNENIENQNFIVLDYDCLLTRQYNSLIEILKSCANIVVTSSSNLIVSGIYRLRVIIFLDRNVKGTEYQNIHDYITKYLKKQTEAVVDGSSRTPSQPFRIFGATKENLVNQWSIFNAGSPLAVDAILRLSPPIIEIHKFEIKNNFNKKNVNLIIEHCTTYKEIFSSAQNGADLTNQERFRLATICKCLGMPDEQIVNLFSMQPNFKEKKSNYYVTKVKPYAPSCKRLAEEFSLCKGTCAITTQLKIGSPIGILKLNEKRSV